MKAFATVFVAAAMAAASAAADGGPTPGIQVGGAGLVGSQGQVRYVTLSDGRSTVVEALAAHSGRVLRFTWLRGAYGIPLVAYDGRAEGLTRDGKLLVLAPFIGPSPVKTTRFVVLDARRFLVRQRIALAGVFSYDALSPDGRTLYLIQYVPSRVYQHYLVRAYDLRSGRLLRRAIADRRERGAMTGTPVTRATGAGGRSVFTLYAKPTGEAFVHALDAVDRRAVCIDLPWRGVQRGIWNVRMSLNGSLLVLRQPGAGRLAAIDTRTFAVRAFRKPALPRP